MSVVSYMVGNSGKHIFFWRGSFEFTISQLSFVLSIQDLDKIMNFVCFVWVGALRPSQHFFSHVGTEPLLPRYYQYFLGGKCILLNDTTRRPE